MGFHLRESSLYWLLRAAHRFDARGGAAVAFSPEAVRSVLVISSTALGDSVMSTAAISALRRRYPAARITALIHRSYAGLFTRLPELDGVVPYHGGYRRFLATAQALRAAMPDVAVILHGNEPQATPLAYLSGARFIFKLPNTSRFRFLLSNPEPVLGWDQLGHGIEQRLRTAALAGADTSDARMHLPVDVSDEMLVARFLAAHQVTSTQRLIGLQTGASSRGRMWPAQHFVELARDLARAHPEARFVLTGAPNEARYCGEIAAAVGAKAIVAAGHLPIEQLPALVRRFALLVSGDTGTLHVAVAVGTPVIGLFAVSDPRRSGPAQDLERHVVIHKPCPERALRSKTDDQSCIAQITVAEVAQAVESVLARDVRTADAEGTGG